MSIPAEQIDPFTRKLGKSKRRTKKHKVRRQTGNTKPPRSRSRDRADEIAALGSVVLAGQFDPGSYEPSYTIREFCQAERISKTLYYELKAKGLGPKEIRYGSGVVRITHGSRVAWQQMMQNPPTEVREALDALRTRRQLQARAAAAKAIESPKHVSNPQSPWRRKRAAQAATPPSRFEHKRRGQREAPR